MIGKPRIIALLLLLASVLAVRADLVVGVQIDGHSQLVISTGDAGGPTQIIWNHLAYSRPGSAGGTYATTLNGYGWFPKWPDSTPNGSPGPSSTLFASVKFSTNGVSLTQEAGRTGVTIVQQPAAANAFTLVVDFDDGLPGADLYSVTLHGVSFTLVPGASAYVSCVSVVWPTETNRLYQVQGSTTVPGGWADLGSPVPGTGTNVVYTDFLVFGQPRRFYRVNPVDQ